VLLVLMLEQVKVSVLNVHQENTLLVWEQLYQVFAQIVKLENMLLVQAPVFVQIVQQGLMEQA
jgi:hypothetical protein